MRQLYDNGARIQLFKDGGEMVRECRRHYEGGGRGKIYLNHESWTGRSFSSWAELESEFYKPWPLGQLAVGKMLEEIANEEMATPVDVRRRQTWSEEDGDLDLDRMIHQEDRCFRRSERRQVQAPRVVTILCVTGGNCDIDSESMFWRGAAVVAAVDKLEAAGYQCEVIAFNRASWVYRPQGTKPRDSFMVWPIKKAGEELETISLINVLSTWFFRNVILGCCNIMGRTTAGMGYHVAYPDGFEKYIETDTGCVPFLMPGVADKRSAIGAVKDLINKIAGEE